MDFEKRNLKPNAHWVFLINFWVIFSVNSVLSSCTQNSGTHTERIELEHGLGTLTIDLPDYFEGKKKCYHLSDNKQGERVEWWFAPEKDLEGIEDTSGFIRQQDLDSIPRGYFYTSQMPFLYGELDNSEPDEIPIPIIEEWMNTVKDIRYRENPNMNFIKDTIIKNTFIFWHEFGGRSLIHGRTFVKGEEIQFNFKAPTQNQELLHSFYEAALTVKVETP